MTTRTTKESVLPTGAKLLAVLAAGAASGGCFTIGPDSNFLGLTPETRMALHEAAAGSEPESSSSDAAPQPPQQQQQ